MNSKKEREGEKKEEKRQKNPEIRTPALKGKTLKNLIY